MSKQILILTTPFSPNIGGVETHLDDLIDVGVKKGYRFTVLTYQPLITEAKGKFIERSKGLTVYRIPWLRMNLFLILEKYPLLEFIYLFPPLFVAGVIFMIKGGSKIRVIHSQGLIAGVVGFALGGLFNKPFLVSTHSIYNFPSQGLYRSFVRTILHKAVKVLTLSKQSLQEIVNLGISQGKVAIFTYWVNQRTFKYRDKPQARLKTGLSKSQFICLFVGRLVRVKGVRELLRSAKITTDKKITYLIIGDGPLASEVTNAAKKSPNLFFLGKIANQDLAKYYNAADVLIVPSVHEEGLGRVILEALSSGLPVIASNRGGIKEVVTSEVGLLIKITPKNINQALKQLSKDKQMLVKRQRMALKYAKSFYGQKNARMILKYYD